MVEKEWEANLYFSAFPLSLTRRLEGFVVLAMKWKYKFRIDKQPVTCTLLFRLTSEFRFDRLTAWHVRVGPGRRGMLHGSSR